MVIGIDLGTTNSLACAWTEEGITLIPNSFGEFLTPSIVSFDDRGHVYVGKIAKEMLVTNPERTFQEFKRTMGTNYTYQVKGEGGKSYTSEELSALVLHQLKLDAENYLGEEVAEAVISVPAYFDDNQRCATRIAGQLAGLKVERLINEPSAAALAHRIQLKETGHQTFIVFDFGGGTLDVSMVDAFENIVEIHGVSGDNHLGGKEFNELIADNFCLKNQLNKKELSLKSQAIIYREAERCKLELTKKNKVARTVYIEGVAYEMTMSNRELVSIGEPLFRKMMKPIKKLLKDSEQEMEEVDAVILVGGSTKMPVVRQFLYTLFEQDVLSDMNPDEVVAMGAGVVAGIKERRKDIKDLILLDICPFTLGLELYNGLMSPLIERNEILPCSKMGFYTTVRDNQEMLEFSIYQGEELRAGRNLFLTKIKLQIPKKPKGEVSAVVQFTYDINGIFQIDIKCLDNGQEVNQTIINKRIGLAENQVREKLRDLEKLKRLPREKEEYKLLLERAERVFLESDYNERVQIKAMLLNYEQVLSQQDDIAIRQEQVKLTLLLDAIERENTDSLGYQPNFWKDEEE